MLIRKFVICASVLLWVPTTYIPQAASETDSGCPTRLTDSANKNSKSISKTLDDKLRLLNKILTSEEKIDRVNKSSHEKAKLLLLQAAKHYEHAVGLSKSGCHTDANTAINLGIGTASEALGLVSNRQRLQARSRQNYHLLRNRINSFRKAIDRIAAEKNTSSDRIINKPQLNELLADADSAMESGDFIRASATLTDAAKIVEAALIVVRANETLFHEKKFDSIEDAYQDEMETNRSYMRLLGKILAIQPEKSQKTQLIRQLVKQNQASVSESMAKMSTGDMETALHLLEAGTGKLIKAMRYFGLAL